MIKITIELISARTGFVSTIGTMFISNRGDRKPTAKKFNYDVKVMRRGRKTYDWFDKKQVTRTGEVLDYPSSAYNVWRLISRALLSAFPEEKNKT